MTTVPPAIVAKDLVVSFRPTLDRRPTLRRSVARLRHKQTETVVALDGVSVRVAKGEAYGVVGHNGAGKSTLLKVLAKTLKPDSGSINIYGRTSTLLQLGVGFNPQLSGRRNVYLGCLAAGLTKAETAEKYDDIVAYAELSEAIDRPVKTYSSGMFARLAFSVGMALEPNILLLDEVLAVGDESFQRKSMAAMQDLLERAGTIVFVSHALANVVEFCDRVMWLEHGRVRTVGPAAEVINEYRTSVMAANGGLQNKQLGGPWSANQKLEAVMRMLKGESADVIVADLGCDRKRLEQWRSIFIRAGRDQFKTNPKPPE